MPRFERSRGRGSSGDFRDRSSKRPSRDGRNFEDGPRGRRDSRSRSRRDIEMTKVICSECGEECEVPFKPTSTKPVYCNDCFAKKGGSNKNSSKDLDIINEKLDKIIKALDIK
ncbi:MAG: hypothetical protein KAU20_07225 [Nanoarchaeota archaeon]|nr:hypothetical protein [Nanoarchaeota archaeon]